MNYKRFYKIYLEKKEQEKVKYDSLKNLNPRQLYSVAQDIRRNPIDHPEIEFMDVLNFKHAGEYDHPLSLSKKLVVSDDSYIVVTRMNISKVSKKDGERLKSKVLDELQRTDSGRVQGNLKISSRFSFSRRPKPLSREQLKQTGEFDSLFLDAIRSEYQLNKKIISSDYFTDKKKKSKERAITFTNNDLLALYNYFKVTTPDVYHYLVHINHNLPKHPSEIPEDFHSLPRQMLNKLTKGNMPPTTIATLTADDTEGYDINGFGVALHSFVRVIEDDSMPISKQTDFPGRKESSQWLRDFSNFIKKDERSFNYEGKYLTFPGWLILQKVGIEKYKQLRNTFRDVSLSSWSTLRWFIKNINSTYWTKDVTLYGPAGEIRTVKPYKKLVEILPEDLENGVNTSPEKAFRNAAERKRKEFEKNSKEIQYTHYNHFQDTDFVKVIRNSKMLKHEGERMDHCVGGYASSCLSGRSLILSLPESTAELDPDTLTVYQHRGQSNYEPPEEDSKLLQQWINVNRQNLRKKQHNLE